MPNLKKIRWNTPEEKGAPTANGALAVPRTWSITHQRPAGCPGLIPHPPQNRPPQPLFGLGNWGRILTPGGTAGSFNLPTQSCDAAQRALYTSLYLYIYIYISVYSRMELKPPQVTPSHPLCGGTRARICTDQDLQPIFPAPAPVILGALMAFPYRNRAF